MEYFPLSRMIFERFTRWDIVQGSADPEWKPRKSGLWPWMWISSLYVYL